MTPPTMKVDPVGMPLAVDRATGVETVAAADVASLSWEELRQNILDCRACGLCAERKQAVPGVGDENAAWLFIGEGPGAEEDARGEPFVGQAGRLLDAMLAAIGLARGKDVYIANAVKCRPPGNRTPENAEMATCFPYLKRQIALIQPELIVLLGKTAVNSVLGETGSLGSLRGKKLVYRNDDREIPVLVTYHPAYLLRNLPDKAKAWEDLCRARALMRGLRELHER
jgi:DNA polymerase